MRRIIVKHGECKRIAKLFKVTPQTVVNALHFKTMSENNKRIRTYALKNGGVEVENNNQ